MTVVDRPRSGSWVPSLIAAGASLVILAVLNPHLLISSTTPAGGDMGAHVLGPAYLRDVLLPQGRILGWSNSWFAGFPAFYFYFPLPSLVIVLLDLVLPYGVAFKVVTVMGLVGLPPAVGFLARSMKFTRPVAALAAAGAAPFALMESYTIYGGNVASTLAGEFSYSWSFSLGMVYLGLLIRAVRDDTRYVPWAAAVLAATALSHILTTLVLVLASFTILFWRGAFKVAVRVWLWGFALAAFWAVPLAARIGLTSDMAWSPLTRWEEVFPLEVWLLLPVAFAGMIWAVVSRPRVLPLVTAMLIPLIYYPLPTLLPRFHIMEGDRWKLWNGRLLPYWYFGVTIFASLALGGLVVWASRRLPERVSGWWPRAVGVAVAAGLGVLVWFRGAPPWAGFLLAGVGLAVVALTLAWPGRVGTRGVLTLAAAAVVVIGGIAGTNYVFKWSNWNYAGYEAKEAWPEYQGVMAAMAELPPGRVMWEQDSTSSTGLDKYGTPMAPMLFPYWTDWSHPSMEGLYFESSLTTPFHFLNATELSAKPSSPIPGLDYHRFDFDRGIPHMRLYGVRYYVAYSEDAAKVADGRPELSLAADAAPFRIYELADVTLVDAARVQPSVFEPGPAAPAPSEPDSAPIDFGDFALDWYGTIDALDHWVTVDGPADWPRVSAVGELTDTPVPGAVPEVNGVVVDDHRISFHTTAVGVPHLIKVSYFPNWVAEGAEGPYRATPSLMVVIPTQEDVVLEFKNSWAEWTGTLLTVGGLALVAAVGVSRWRRRQRPANSPQSA